MKIKVCMTDLTHDVMGWSANCCWVNEKIIEVDDKAKEGSIRRKIKDAVGAKGMRPDGWAGTEWCWRDGHIGVYAEIEEL